MTNTEVLILEGLRLLMLAQLYPGGRIHTSPQTIDDEMINWVKKLKEVDDWNLEDERRRKSREQAWVREQERRKKGLD